MEFKDYWKIVIRNKNLFWLVFLGTIVVGLMVFSIQPKIYLVQMSLDIGRKGNVKLTEDVRNKNILKNEDENDYDYFYRLEADDRFAKNIVQWLKDPEVKERIFELPIEKNNMVRKHKELKLAKKTFKAEQLAPAYVQIKLKTIKPEEAEVIFQSTKKIITERSEKMFDFDKKVKGGVWLEPIFYPPTVSLYKISFGVIMIISIIFGFWLALLGVGIKHYWQED